ncbi:hypothetical protein JCM24511_05945 [Saitozyma sp. JCM 24511]|nr:hypothetical protein JCM24511_05945 [Saitozyma sp. JCM 24511]
MDRGAARSKKRSQQQERERGAAGGPTPTPRPAPGSDRPTRPLPSSSSGPSKPRAPTRQPHPDPNQYKPKAIRTSAALIYSESPFPLPPTPDMLANVRRVDLAGSGVTDVSFLQDTGVTWLSLVGCPVEKGWKAVASLKELAVLNISNCGLKALPKNLKGLKKLKALVAMNNDWESLDDDVVSAWPELNSLIVSHSPNLVSLPEALSTRNHLAKLTFSHCPRLTAGRLPDLSALPLLRDVKMNNLPLLSSLPAHISSWGTGDLSLVGKGGGATLTSSRSGGGPAEIAATASLAGSSRKGDGLEVLDLGNCSLTFEAVSTIFSLSQPSSSSSSTKSKSPTWPHLRSLSLHSNPLGVSHPNYPDLLQASAALPDLQIIDAKRVRERKRKGEVSESKADRKMREKREKTMRPSGANMGGGKMRSWGGDGDGEGDGDGDGQGEDGRGEGEGEGIGREQGEGDGGVKKGGAAGGGDKGKSKKKRRREDGHDTGVGVAVEVGPGPTDRAESKRPKHGDHKRAKSTTVTATAPTGTVDDTVATPVNRAGKNESSVLQVIEVGTAPEEESTGKAGKGGREGKEGKDKSKAKKEKGGKVKVEQGAKSKGGVDLREVLTKPQAESAGDVGGSGLGVGGW